MPAPRKNTGILVAAFLHFDVSFLCWVMIGALGVFITRDLHITAAQKGLLVAIPILSGSVMRVVVGRIADSWSIKRAGYLTIAGAALGLTIGATLAHSYGALLGVGILLGISGASFAVALPMASRWFPADRQGMALGIAAAGNSGTVLATFFAPRIAVHIGWHATMAVALIPLAAMTVVWALLARDVPQRVAPTPIRLVIVEGDFWGLAAVYSVTFGGFVGLTSFMPIFLNSEYHLAAVVAGEITAAAALLGSACRPFGGWLADRTSGRRVGLVALAVVVACAPLAGAHISLGMTTAALLVMLTALGAGNGAVFQMVPQRFPKEIAVVTGLVGAAGGFGGFLLPTMLGGLKDLSGGYVAGFAVFGVAAGGAVAILAIAGGRWARTWLHREAIAMALPGAPVVWRRSRTEVAG
ncbi:MAG: nitrate/nitrite transporter [Candidatus Dormibacteria bacterium]